MSSILLNRPAQRDTAFSGQAPSVVIVGAGHAGIEVADSLRSNGHTGPVTIISDEDCLPYQRPPLSKEHTSAASAPQPLLLRGEQWFETNQVEFLRGKVVHSINRRARRISLGDGTNLPYDFLVLATGAAPRTLECVGADLAGVVTLRNMQDAQILSDHLGEASCLVVAGAGFIGLELAATARQRGIDVTIVDRNERPMARAVSATTGEWFSAAHSDAGVSFSFGDSVTALRGENGRVQEVETAKGRRIPADLVVTGIGVLPRTGLAEDAGLDVDNGVVVDGNLRTSDPHIFAVGDCAVFPSARSEHPLRLESVQNATDQARHVAGGITGAGDDYDQVPWFWSIQGPWKLQIAGLSAGVDRIVVREHTERKLAVFCYRNDQLIAVETVNNPAVHMAARKILAANVALSPEQAADASINLKDVLASAPAA